MAQNKRVFYAIQQVGMKERDPNSYNALHGVQSVGVTTTFNLEQVFELGQINIYENIEEIPDVQVTLQKVLDGYPLIYHRATTKGTTPTLTGRQNATCMMALAVFPDTQDTASGTPPSIMETSGLYVSSLSYTFSVDGNFTEDVTLVGNDKIWKGDTRITNTAASARSDSLEFAGAFTNQPDSPISTNPVGVARRQDLMFDFDGDLGTDTNGAVADHDATILPPEIDGIQSSGVNRSQTEGVYDASIQSITVSTDLGREEINELGRRKPYHRFITYPTEVTCEIVANAKSGDLVSATEEGILTTSSAQCTDQNNLADRTIRIASCEGTRVYLGVKNKLQSVAYGGGDAGGGNATNTYTYTTFNDFTVMHSGDPNSNGETWWDARDGWLVN